MTETAERVVQIPASRARVWRYLQDFTNSTQWNPSIVRVHRLTGHGGQGTVYGGVCWWDGARVDVIYSVEECQPGSCLRVLGHTDDFISDLQIRLTGGAPRVEVAVTTDVVAEITRSRSPSAATIASENEVLARRLSTALATL